MSNVNPYATPLETNAPPPINSGMNLASQNQRFLTAILDNLILYAINLGVGAAIGIFFFGLLGIEIDAQNEGIWDLIFWVIGTSIVLFYFAVLEATTGRTIGKFITGTRVVNATSGKPSFKQILGRTFCRLIPFEAVSFLGNKGFPIGWHDSIPGTRVVKAR